MTQIALNKTIYFKGTGDLIDIEFTQLINSASGSQTADLTVDDFFIDYDNIFYQIPNEGDTNSHRYILNREADYLGVKLSDDIDVQALLDEITSLRQELLNSQQVISNLTNTVS